MVIKHPDVSVTLTGHDGNIFAIMGTVSRALKEAGYKDEVDAFFADITSSKSYDEALVKVMQWVSVD